MNVDSSLIDLVAGPDAGRQLRLHPGRHLIGRAPGLAVTLDDPTVEAHHASLEIASDGGWQLTQLTGRSPLAFDCDRGVIDIGCSRIERGADAAAGERLEGGWVRLGIGLDPALPDDGSDGVTSFPQMIVIAELGDRDTEIVGLVDATGGDAARAALRWIVAQLASRPNWTLVDMLGINPQSRDAIAELASGTTRPLLVTDQAGLVRGAGSPIRALSDAGVASTAIVVTQAGAPVLEACTSVLEIGPRWRSRWYPAGDQASAVRLHATGASAVTARALLDGDRTLVAEQVTRSRPEFGRHVVGVPQPA